MKRVIEVGPSRNGNRAHKRVINVPEPDTHIAFDPSAHMGEPIAGNGRGYVQLPTEVEETVQRLFNDVDGTLSCMTLVGSRAQQTHKPDSDYDLRGFYVPSQDATLGFFRPEEQVHHLDDMTDMQIHEINHFSWMLAKQNPFILETLYSPKTAVSGPAGDLFYQHRQMFLTSHIADSFAGAARSNMHETEKIEELQKPDTKRPKRVRHMFRFLRVANETLQSGEMNLDASHYAHELDLLAELPTDKLKREFDRQHAALFETKERTKLPDMVDRDDVNRLVIEAKKAEYGL